MTQLLVILAIGAGAFFFARLLKQPSHIKIRWLIYAIAGILIVLTLTGRLHWLGAVFAGLLLLGKKLLLWVRFIPLLSGLFTRYQTHKQQSRQSERTDSRQNGMSQEEAYAILELQPGATREDIIAAHKRLMQKMHPDRGGSTHLAQKINQAKNKLLNGL